MFSSNRKFLFSSMAMIILFVSLSFAQELQALSFDSKPEEQAPKNANASLLETWGIEIVGIRLAAQGHMVDFRYRVVDPAKAASLFARKTKPYLMDQESGKVLSVPRTAKVGPLRSSNQPQPGKVYWMFFGNPRVVEAGSKVTVVIGEFKAENLTVE